jgi:dihydrofolate reductase
MDVILLMAMTLDGKIARNSNEIVDWTGAADKKYFVQVTQDAGVVIMGSRTFDTIGKPLAGRKNIVMTRNMNRARKTKADNLVFTDQSPGEIIKTLKEEGFEKAALIGGATINSLFARENLITEIHVTLVPALFGKGLSLFDDSLFEEPLDLKLEFKETRELDPGHLLLIYRVLPGG